MAILRGTSRSIYPDFSDPNLGVGPLLDAAQNSALNFLNGLGAGVFESKFVEDGVENIPGFTTIDRTYSQVKQPSRRSVITQRPKATVFIKKRMFSSLRSNYDVRFLDEKEKLFLRAAKLMFERKTLDLSFYESLINIESIFDNNGFLAIDQVNDATLNALLNLIETSFIGVNVLSGNRLSLSEIINSTPDLLPFKDILDELLKLQARNRRARGNMFTTWVTDPDNPDVTGLGAGVGVIELNLVNSFQSNVSLDGAGSASFTIEDPYRISVITDLDIEIALREAIAEQDSPAQNVREVGSFLLRRAEILDQRLNDIRRSRGASTLNFAFAPSNNATTPIGNPSNVTVTVVDTGEQVTQFTIGQIGGIEALDPRELALATQIINLMASFQTVDNRSIGTFQTINQEFNSVRQRLRNEFVGHSIIQQMDSVHVFVNSNTRDDTPGIDGAFDAELLAGNLRIQGDNLDIQTIRAEWEQVAPRLPFTIYLAMRDRTVFRGDGVQVFGGVVDNVLTNYRAESGAFSLNVRCKDNTEFLRLGRITINPTLTQQKGMLHDPLTPFELQIDPGTGLIESTPQLSTENKSRLEFLRFDDGFFAGKRATEQNIFQDKLLGGQVTSYQHLPGLVYQWKQGIISETLKVNLRRSLDGTGSSIADAAEAYGITVLQNPFAGLDSADVVSILVTGRPHNYATFLRHSLDIGTFTIDNTNNRKFYFNYLFDFLERQDHILGDFVPAKPTIIDPAIATAAFREKRRLDGFNSQLQRLRVELAAAQDAVKAGFGSADRVNQVQSRIDRIQGSIDIALVNAQEGINVGQENQNNVSLNVIGNEVHINFPEVENPNIRRKLRYQTKRKSEDVRFNLDKNFLIVSEQYDSDVDIQAFARRLKDQPAELFNTEFQSPWELCQTAAQTVGFELFADSQGNLVFRPPEYNKTPLSLLLRLLSQNQTEGMSWAPEFLRELFGTRSRAMEERLLLLELQILENLILLNLGKLEDLLQGRGFNNLSLSVEKNPASETWQLNIDKLRAQEEKETIFTPAEQEAIRNQQSAGTVPVEDLAKDLITVRNSIFDIQGRLDKKKDPDNNQDIQNAATEISEANLGGNNANAPSNRLRYLNNIGQFVNKRLTLGKAYTRLQQNIQEFEVTDGKAQRSELLVPSAVIAQLNGLTGEDDIPSVPKFLEPLIENDLANEDGFRSGRRFIVKDDVILGMDLQVRTPDFNLIEVNGNQDFVGGNQGDIAGLPIFWSGAVDFDSWRQFGFRPGQAIHRPDFTSAELQSAPYALFKLYEQRRKIHSGSIRIVGNEHYQVGDVIYLNNRCMLYYVMGVSHSFNFSNGEFVTTLELGYGRALGEYIPTPLDIIGKGLLASSRNAFSNLKANRSTVSANHAVHLETLYLSDYLDLGPFNSFVKEEAFKSSKENQNIVKRAIRKAVGKINKPVQGESRIEVRSYFAGGINALETKFRARLLGEWVRDLLTRQVPANQAEEDLVETTFDAANVTLVPPIDISPSAELNEREEKLRRFPSSQAWGGTKPFLQDGVPIPVNAVDIFFVFERSRFGDQNPIELDDPAPQGIQTESDEALASGSQAQV